MEFNTTMIQSLGFVPGTMVKNYRIVQEISRSGMGVVYLALDLKTQQKVAIKVILHSNFINDDRASKRFLRESEVLSTLEHPNIVHRYAMGIQGNVPYIVMQYVEGIPITEYARQINKNNWKLNAQLMYKLANALAYIHANGIIHRDLKANNILVQADGEPVILDFGLAKILNGKGFNLTHDGEILGSLNMSPEQAEGQNSKIDERSDIYSLGTIFYEILTGVSLVKNGSVVQVLKQIINNKPIAPHRLNKKVPIELEKICLKCLEKSPNKRFKHASLLEKQLKNYLEGKSSNTKSSNFSLESFLKNKTLIISACILLAIVIFFGIISKSKSLNKIENATPIYDQQTQQFFEYVKRSGFRFLGYKKYSCGSYSNVVAEFQQESTNMEFVLIPAGKFTMELRQFFAHGQAISALPSTEMTIAPFLMSKYECTQTIWNNVMGNVTITSANNPISSVTWNECIEFCKKTRLNLPSEAQWEYACRAGSETNFFWGNNDKELNQYIVTKQIAPVGSKKPNAFGLYDIMGNVSEWCLDRFHPTYNTRPRNEMPWIEEGRNRVIRGSNIRDVDSNFHRSGIRREEDSNASRATIGVRFVFLSQANAIVWNQDINEAIEKKLDKISDKKSGHKESADEKYQLGLMYLKQKNFEKARQNFELAMEQGNVDAQNALGCMYYAGHGIARDVTKAKLLFEKAANQGLPAAQSNLGRMYYTGIGLPQDFEKAYLLYTKAAEQNYATAQYSLGQMYEKGLGVKQDFQKARYWYEKAANLGDEDAQFALGFAYFAGQNVPQDFQKAYIFIEQAAKQGNAQAQNLLSIMYQNGQGVKVDFQKAYFWLMKAANQNEPNSLTQLGIFYTIGKGEKKDLAKARMLFEKAANKGHKSAQFLLANMYYKGQGVKQDFAKARLWLEKAANQGDNSAQNLLGIMYQHGRGVKQDFIKARSLFEQAANQGFSASQYNLAMMYYKGKDIKQDIEKAIYWFIKAAEQGDSDAQFQLGVIYNLGQGVAKDITKAIYWLEKAAEKGDINAQFSLATIYNQGEGIQRNLQKAYFWYEKAAQQGLSVAQYNLGIMYQNGEGVTQDTEKARLWLEKAANQGLEMAQQKLKELNQKK